MNMNRWLISFLELTFLDHIFSTQMGGSFLFWNVDKNDPKMQVPKKK